MIPESRETWSLHPKLAADTVPVGDLPLSNVAAMNDANYPWLILTPRRGGAVELIDLVEADQARLMQEIAMVARALKAITACDKLNIGALGNLVPQLHVHIVGRRRGDAAWPSPVWGQTPRPYAPAAAARFVRQVQGQLEAAEDFRKAD